MSQRGSVWILAFIWYQFSHCEFSLAAHYKTFNVCRSIAVCLVTVGACVTRFILRRKWDGVTLGIDTAVFAADCNKAKAKFSTASLRVSLLWGASPFSLGPTRDHAIATIPWFCIQCVFSSFLASADSLWYHSYYHSHYNYYLLLLPP